jgi:hypothetical protein
LAALAAVVVEAPVLAVVDQAHLPVLVLAQVVARRGRRVQLPRLALLLLLSARARLPVPAVRPVVVALADLVVEPAVLLQHLLSRQSFSAAMARITP